MPAEQLPGLEHRVHAEERATEPSPLVESTVARPPSKHAQRGESLLQSGNRDEGLKELEKALKADPKDAYALATKARVLRATDPSEAAKLMEQAIRFDPGLDWALLELTDLLRELGRDGDVKKIRPIARPPSEHAQRGEFLRRSGNPDEALMELEKALKADPEDAFALASKGRILRAEGRSDDAAKLLEHAIRLEPGLDWALLELTDLLCELERGKDAEEICAKLVRTHSDDAPVHGIFGRLLGQIGDLERAEEYLERAVELRSDLAWLHTQLGEVLRRRGNPRRALERFSQAQNVASEKLLSGSVTAWILTRKGLSLMHAGRCREAVKALTQALDLSPRYVLAMRLKARALWESRERERCFASLEEAISVSANPLWAYIEIVNYARDMGLLEEALVVLDECLADDPNSEQLLIRKGELLHRVGDFEGAVRTLVKAEEIDEKNWRALHLRGSALKYLGEEYNEEALAAIEKAIQIRGSTPTLLVARADILRARSDAVAAKRDYRNTVEQLEVRRKERPQSVDAATMWLMGWCWLWLDENDLAFRILGHAKSLEPDLYIVRFCLGLALLIRGKTAQAEREYDAALDAIRGESPLLRRGILKSSLYALRVAGIEEDESPETPAEQLALDQNIVRRLKGELEDAAVQIANSEPKDATALLGDRSTGLSESAERTDDTEASDVVPRVNLLVRPAADPMVPMIRLDHEFKILDWNIAASLAFDETLEGRRGQWVGDWIVRFFDNPLAVAEHGQTAFGDQGRLPSIDVEDQEFTSRTYGKVNMTKRAFMIPNDDGTCLGWLLIFELRFSTRGHSWQFRKNLINRLNSDNVWSAHALSYDAVLSSSSVYDELLRTLIGETGPLQQVPNGARILDLGAGTGGLTFKLATFLRDPFIVAVDINNAMLDILQEKCRGYMRVNQQNRGVVAIRQDISKLSGVLGAEKELFDYAFLVNVLNTLPEPEKALKGVFDLLKPGGELRITGPRDDSKVEVLFDALKEDLENRGLLEELRPYYEDLRALNADQLSETFRWTTGDVEQMLLDAGFSKIIDRGDSVHVYAGQAMLVAARR